jgi:hypothetical protein
LLTLTNAEGKAKMDGGATLVHLLRPEEDPVTIARMLMNKTRRETGTTPFNAPLDLPPLSIV